MTITYHSGGRFQGISTGNSISATSPDHEDDFSSDQGWVDTGQTAVSGGDLNITLNRSSINSGAYYDLGAGNVSNTAWVLRFKLVILTSANGTNNSVALWISDEQYNGINANKHALGLGLSHDSTHEFFLIAPDGTYSFYNTTGTGNPTTGTYYIEIKRTSTTKADLRIYSDSGYSTLLASTINHTISSTIDDMRYLVCQNMNDGGSGGSWDIEIDDLKFYDGVTSVSLASTNSDHNTLTNVPDYSRFEETDTRKMYNLLPSSNVTTTIDGSYTILTFTGNTTFTPTSSFNVEYLVLGGGAGGAYDRGGGGGSGAFRTATGFGVTAQTYNITVGAGGAGGAAASGDRGGTGGDSIFSTITSNGGGGGGTNNDPATYYSGNGSGGGGNHEAQTGGTGGTYGNNGGYGTGGSSYQAGGGGGSSAAGASSSSGGAGGAGIANPITGSTSGELSSGTYYLGGGGAGGRNADSGTQGGLGGGGNMGNSSHRDGFAGDAITGAGGGGAYGGLGSAGGDGGSGIVIIKFTTSGNGYTLEKSWKEKGTT